MAASSPTAASSDVMIPQVIKKITALCKSMGIGSYAKEPIRALPENRPPLRSREHVEAAEKFGRANAFYNTTYNTSDLKVREGLQQELKFQERNLKQLKDNDDALAKEYEHAQDELKKYISVCTEASKMLGPLGPTGMHKDKLFGALRTELGPDADTQVPLHEVLLSLQALKTTVHKVDTDEAFRMIVSCMPNKEGMHKGSGQDFTKYYNDLCALYQRLEAGAPTPEAGSAPELVLTLKSMRQLLMCFIDHGDHGARVHAQLSAITEPAYTALSELNKWYLVASATVDAEAAKSHVIKTAPKVAALVSKGAETARRSGTEAVRRSGVSKEEYQRMTSPEGVNDMFKTYKFPATEKICPWPHFNDGTHYGHECRQVAKVVNHHDFKNTGIAPEVFKLLKKQDA